VAEEGKLGGMVALRIPCEAVVASHADAAARPQDSLRAFGASFERLAVAVDDALRHPELRSALDARQLEVQRRHARHVALEHEFQAFVVDEGRMLDRIVTGLERILDSFRRAAVTGHLQAVIMGRFDDRVHLLERHAERVVIVRIGRGGVAGRISFDPLDAVFHELAHRGTRFMRAVDDQHQPFHADLAIIRIPIHQPRRAADFPPAGGEPRTSDEAAPRRLP